MESVAAIAGDEVESRTSAAARFYLPELDSLRALAFFAVFVYHLHPVPAWMLEGSNRGLFARVAAMVWQSGAFGVDLFFTLSAYLLSELMMRERQKFGRVDVGAFYLRRILRIWPLYYGFLGALFLGLAILPSAKVPWRLLPGFALFYGNFALASSGVFAILPLAILWSVSVEEQFYLVWPWVAGRMTRRGLGWIGLAMWAFSIVSRWILITHGYPLAAIWWNTFARLDSLACGVLICAALDGSTSYRFERARGAIAIGGVMLLMFAGFCGPRTVNAGTTLLMLGYPAAALGCGAIVLAAIGTSRTTDAWMVNPWLTYFGRISYGLYVFHGLMVVLSFKTFERVGWPGWLAWPLYASFALAGTIASAAASYRWFESPFLRLKSRFQLVRSHPV